MRTKSAAAWWAYPVAVVMSLAMLFVVLELRRADLSVPFTYRLEALFNAMLVKGTLEGGWPLDVPALAAPDRLDLRDVPLADNNLHFVVIRLLGLVSPDPAVVMNVFSLLTFPLTALAALYVFRRFGLAVVPALFGSLLYTFVPFHLQRLQYHLFLAAYYLVPLVVMVALWIASGSVALVDARAARWSGRWCRPKLVGSAIVCVLVASSGTYYAFFACFFVLVAGVLAACRARDARHLALPVALILLTVAILVAHYWPNIRYVREHGSTRLVLRSPVDSELYGLRIWQMLAPVRGHRLDRVAQFRDEVAFGRLPNESDDSALGLIGSLGFLTLLAWLWLPGREPAFDPDHPPGVMRDLSLLNLSAVLLGTVGGLGALVALVVPQIRAYNRISVYIAFFALFAVVAGLDRVGRRYCRDPKRRATFALCLGALLLGGVYDQSSTRAIPNYEAVAAEFRRDAAFVDALRTTLPRDAMIFQLPVVPFPEHPPVNRMQDYDHLRGYLHASGLRWSYGAIRGREGGAWQEWVATQSGPSAIDTLAAAGFSGLYVNRDAYPDRGAKLTAELAVALGQSPLGTDHPRLVFFDLRPHQAALRARSSPAEWDAKREAALHPLLVVWEHGCSDLEVTPQSAFRWCAAAGEWRLTNGGREVRRVTLEMSLASNSEGTVWIDSPLFRGQWRIGPLGRSVSQTISISPGRHTIPFRCDVARVRALADRRHLVFRVHDFRIIPAD